MCFFELKQRLQNVMVAHQKACMKKHYTKLPYGEINDVVFKYHALDIVKCKKKRICLFSRLPERRAINID